MPYNPALEPESPFLTHDECKAMNPVLHTKREAEPDPPKRVVVVLTRAQIAALNADVIAADRAVVEARSRLAEVGKRRRGLEDRLAAERATELSEPPALDPSLVDALASDPSAECCPDAVKGATERHFSYRSASDEWRTRIELVRQAIGKVDGEVAAIEGEISALEEARERSWEAFLVGAHCYLVAEFQKRFAAINRDFIEPLVDMQRMVVPKSVPEGGMPASRHLISYYSTRLDRRSAVILDRAVEDSERAMGRSSVETIALFEYPHTSINNLQPTEAIERFRTSLPASG